MSSELQETLSFEEMPQQSAVESNPNRLQEILAEFGCTMLNYTNNKIYVDYFYNEHMYDKFLSGMNCRQGMGIYDTNQVLEFNKLEDKKLVIVQHEGLVSARYKYVSVFKGTMQYKGIDDDYKKVNKSLTFRIRKNEYGGELNLFTEKFSLDFLSMLALKDFLSKEYRTYKLIDWNVYV